MQSNAAVIILNGGGKKAACSRLVPYQCGVIWCSFYVFVTKYIIRPGPSCLWNAFLDLLIVFKILSGVVHLNQQKLPQKV